MDPGFWRLAKRTGVMDLDGVATERAVSSTGIAQRRFRLAKGCNGGGKLDRSGFAMRTMMRLGYALEDNDEAGLAFQSGVDIGGGGTKGGGGENGGDPGQGRPVTGPQRPALLAKLIGVNKEKEPLSGTGPERRLFDRSNTCSEEMLVNDIGI